MRPKGKFNSDTWRAVFSHDTREAAARSLGITVRALYRRLNRCPLPEVEQTRLSRLTKENERLKQEIEDMKREILSTRAMTAVVQRQWCGRHVTTN